MNGGTSRGFIRPSNKTIALGVFTLAIIISVVIGREKEPSEEPLIVFEGKTAERASVIEQDSDNDGLKDWEETLLKTNPKIADTDGDGKTDLVERDEARKEEQERQDEFARNLNPRDDDDWGTLSFTEQVSRVFLSQYLQLKESGRPITGGDTLKIVQDLPSYTPPTSTLVVYTTADITTKNDSSANALRLYGNEVGAVLAVPEGDTAPNELLILQDFIQTNDKEAFARDIASAQERYDIVIAGLQKIIVPATLAAKHVELMNALSAVKNDLSLLGSVNSDPVLAISALSTYNKNTTRRGDAFQAVRDVLNGAHITYSESENGYLLMYIPSTS